MVQLTGCRRNGNDASARLHFNVGLYHQSNAHLYQVTVEFGDAATGRSTGAIGFGSNQLANDRWVYADYPVLSITSCRIYHLTDITGTNDIRTPGPWMIESGNNGVVGSIPSSVPEPTGKLALDCSVITTYLTAANLHLRLESHDANAQPPIGQSADLFCGYNATPRATRDHADVFVIAYRFKNPHTAQEWAAKGGVTHVPLDPIVDLGVADGPHPKAGYTVWSGTYGVTVQSWVPSISDGAVRALTLTTADAFAGRG